MNEKCCSKLKVLFGATHKWCSMILNFFEKKEDIQPEIKPGSLRWETGLLTNMPWGRFSHPAKIDLNKKLDPKQKTIQVFNIDA